MGPNHNVTPVSPKRHSVQITEQDRHDLERIKTSPEALSQLPETATKSQSALIHAVFEKGLEMLKEDDLDRAYAEIAEEQRETASARRRRAVSRPRGRAGAL